MKFNHSIVVFISLSFRLIAAQEPFGSVAVIGAGISGLTAAYSLKKLGYSVTALEASTRVGGKIESMYNKDGAPTSDFTVMDNETEAKTQELCGNERPTELGAVLSFGSGARALADELGVPYGDPNLINHVVVRKGVNYVNYSGTTGSPGLVLNEIEFMELIAEQAAPGEDPWSENAAAVQAFFIAAKKFPEITSVRLDGNNAELAMPLDQFAAKHGFSLLVDAMRPFITGYGYGYTDRVPAGILLKFMHLLVPLAAGLAGEDPPVVFPCGFQSLPEALAKVMDVRLGAKVSSVQRKSGFITVQADGQPSMRFNHLVISTTLDLVPGFLDVDAMEEEIFGKLSFYRYLTTMMNVDLENREQPQGNEIEYYADQGFEENKNSVTLFGRMGTGGYAEIAYQIIDTSMSKEEAAEVLDKDMASYWNGSVVDIIVQREWSNYFPTVSSQDFAEGFYDDMESLQGHKNTYYVGSQLSFEMVYHSEWFARDLISRKFPVNETAELEDNETVSPSSCIRTLSSALLALMAIAFLMY